MPLTGGIHGLFAPLSTLVGRLYLYGHPSFSTFTLDLRLLARKSITHVHLLTCKLLPCLECYFILLPKHEPSLLQNPTHRTHPQDETFSDNPAPPPSSESSQPSCR